MSLFSSFFRPQADHPVIVTGADKDHFANLRVLVGSWLQNMQRHPLVVCDYGLSEGQRAELQGIKGVQVLRPPEPITHPWQGKALVGRFLDGFEHDWDILVWIDADALFNHAMPELPPLIEGYDMLIDAHVQAVGEIVHDCNLAPLALRRDDAYFSAGWWIVRKGPFLRTYERLCALVQGKGNLWECDAFVAAIYAHKLKIRTLCGGVWHARGKTSLSSCQVEGLEARHAGQPIYVVHANDGYTVRDTDKRRVFVRPELAAIQDHYEKIYLDFIGKIAGNTGKRSA